MAFTAGDFNGRTIGILGKISQAPMATVQTLTLFNTPPQPPGSLAKTFVLCVIVDNPAAGNSGTLTASIGSTATATDFATSGSIAVPVVASAPSVVMAAPATGIVYASGVPFNFKITAGGVGAADITAYGWIE
jgi:hypothetical protein